MRPNLLMSTDRPFLPNRSSCTRLASAPQARTISFAPPFRPSSTHSGFGHHAAPKNSYRCIVRSQGGLAGARVSGEQGDHFPPGDGGNGSSKSVEDGDMSPKPSGDMVIPLKHIQDSLAPLLPKICLALGLLVAGVVGLAFYLINQVVTAIHGLHADLIVLKADVSSVKDNVDGRLNRLHRDLILELQDIHVIRAQVDDVCQRIDALHHDLHGEIRDMGKSVGKDIPSAVNNIRRDARYGGVGAAIAAGVLVWQLRKSRVMTRLATLSKSFTMRRGHK